MSEVKETVMKWKHRLNQRYKVLKLLVASANNWITPDILRVKIPEIKNPDTVLYDMAMRNPADSPKGQDYYDRNRIYPHGSDAKPILEYDETFGYRIFPNFFEVVLKTV